MYLILLNDVVVIAIIIIIVMVNININKNALSSVESRLFVDKIRSEEVNRARAFVTREGGGGALRI